MKIIQIIPSLQKGGAERFVVDLANYFAQDAKHEVWLLSLFDNKKEDTFINELNSSVHYKSFGKKRGFSLKVFFQINRFLLKLKPDVVHTHINAFEYAGLFRLQSTSCHFIHTIHSKAEKECPSRIIKAIRKYFYVKNTIPVTISNDGRKTFRKYYGLQNDKLIQNGRSSVLRTSAFLTLKKKYTDDDYYTIVHIGRIIDVKNQELLIRSVASFNRQAEKKAKLLIIGDIQDAIIYRKLLELNEANSKFVFFIGGQSNIGDYLHLADIFCLSSLHEGMPISLIEAFSAGCIPISTPVGGIPEMIEHGVNGFLSEDMTERAYNHVLKQALSVSNKKHIQENAIQTFFRHYNINICARKYIDIYRCSGHR